MKIMSDSSDITEIIIFDFTAAPAEILLFFTLEQKTKYFRLKNLSKSQTFISINKNIKY